MILKGKTVLITGVGPGMGVKMALGAAREGAKVAIGARSQDFLDGVRGQIEADGGECISVTTDVSRQEDCQRLADTALDRFGCIDGLVNSAYYHPDWQNFETANLEQWARAYDVACMGALRMIRAVLPAMRKQRAGSIVNISTLATRKPMPGEGGYAIAKAGLGQVTRQLAVELGCYGIRVNQALMGWMLGVPLETAFHNWAKEGSSYDILAADVAARIPLARIPPDQDCAKAVFMLLSDYASEITGAALEVNGGEWVSP